MKVKNEAQQDLCAMPFGTLRIAKPLASIKMKKTTYIFILLLLTSFAAYSQQGYSRILSYTQWFDEMEACTDSVYKLNHALITPDLEMDTARRKILIVRSKVVLYDVVFEGYSPTDMEYLKGWQDNSAELKNFRFQKEVVFDHCKGTIPAIFNGEFLEDVIFQNIDTDNDLRIYRNVFHGTLSLMDANLKKLLLGRDTVYSATIIKNVDSENIQIYYSQFEIAKPKLGEVEYPFLLRECDLDRFAFLKNTIKQTAADQVVYFNQNNIAYTFAIFESKIAPFTLLSHQTIGRLVLGIEMIWERGIGLFTVVHNDFSFFNWEALKGKVFTYNYEKARLGEKLKVFKGETVEELDNRLDFDRLILAKQSIRNTFIYQGLREYANGVLIEIRDLETRMWQYRYKKEKTVNAYFHWKMNVFLKEFSAYGTNPVIAIIYSLKVILLFGLIYLFFHNNSDIGGRKMIGKRLRFMLKYLQVNKGLSELDSEHQIKNQNEVAFLKSENVASNGKIPAFFTWAISCYVKSNLISDSLRKFVLRKMDVLKGTYAILPNNQQRKVAILSGIWFIGFLLYTLVLKTLNALTLSLNAFTTLGFGNIPTKGFSRYIVIVQGFIGWVLMTIFSVTLITQLIQ